MENAASGGDGKMSLTAKVIVGLVAGIILGLGINILGLNPAGGFIDTYITNGLFHIVGKMFVNALKMMVVPLVLFSLICGVCGIGDIKALGRVGSKSFGLYILTTLSRLPSQSPLLLSAALAVACRWRQTPPFQVKMHRHFPKC